MQVSEALEAYKYQILTCTPRTQRWYVDKLTIFSDWCTASSLSLSDLRSHHVMMFLEDVKKRRNPQTHQPLSSYTVHGYGQVVKIFLGWCWKEDLGVSERARTAKIAQPDQKIIEVFSKEQVRTLFSACGSQRYAWMKARDQAILGVFFGTGVRSGELLGLCLNQIHLDPYDAWIRVMGKGRKERVVSLGKRANRLLYRYITRYRKAPANEQHVFLGRQGPLKQGGLDEMFDRLKQAARITGVRCSPHTCRHTYAVNYLKAGGNIKTLSSILGHGSVTVTEIYTKTFSPRDAKEQIDVLADLLPE